MTKIKENVEDEIARRAMIQREIQMAVKLAQMRDTLQIFGSAYTVYISGLLTARILRKPLPPITMVPAVIGGLVLGNMADMAYGNKLNRVVREAEYILDHEKGRFVPFHQAPFAKFYTDEERAAYPATAVGDLYPSKLVARSNGE